MLSFSGLTLNSVILTDEIICVAMFCFIPSLTLLDMLILPLRYENLTVLIAAR